MKEISVGRTNMQLRRCEGTAAQDLLIYKPLVVVFIKLRLESGIRNVIGGRPLPNIADHLVTAERVCAVRVRAN